MAVSCQYLGNDLVENRKLYISRRYFLAFDGKLVKKV